MSGVGWYALAVLAAQVVLYAAQSLYWRCRCAEYEARADEQRRQIERLWDERRAARTKL